MMTATGETSTAGRNLRRRWLSGRAFDLRTGRSATGVIAVGVVAGSFFFFGIGRLRLRRRVGVDRWLLIKHRVEVGGELIHQFFRDITHEVRT